MIGQLCSFGAIVSGVITATAINRVAHDQIDFSLPVVLGAISATAIFTWGVAKYDVSKQKRQLRFEARIEKTLHTFEKKQDAVDERSSRIEERMERIEQLICQLCKTKDDSD